VERDLFSLHGVILDIGASKFSDEMRRRIAAGNYEEEEVWSAPRIIEDGDVVLDIGGGCGFISAFVAKYCSPKRVISVEADPDLISIIECTHALNGTRADVFHEVLADADGETDFWVGEDFWTSSLESATGDRTAIRKVRVPMKSFSFRLEQWRPDCILVDIEGNELDLLKSPLPWFVRRIMVEVHAGVYGLDGVKDIMDRLSRSGFAYVPDASNGKVLCYRRLQND
jgi:FkbM family methyltransferase